MSDPIDEVNAEPLPLPLSEDEERLLADLLKRQQALQPPAPPQQAPASLAECLTAADRLLYLQSKIPNSTHTRSRRADGLVVIALHFDDGDVTTGIGEDNDQALAVLFRKLGVTE